MNTSDGALIKRSLERPKPSFRVTSKDLPEIKDWEVGKKYKVHATIEMRSHSKGSPFGDDSSGASKKEHSADLVIHEIKTSGKED